MARVRGSADNKARHKRYEAAGTRERNKQRRVRKDWRRSRAGQGEQVPQALLAAIGGRR